MSARQPVIPDYVTEAMELLEREAHAQGYRTANYRGHPEDDDSTDIDCRREQLRISIERALRSCS